jgi:hypothetical protein
LTAIPAPSAFGALPGIFQRSVSLTGFASVCRILALGAFTSSDCLLTRAALDFCVLREIRVDGMVDAGGTWVSWSVRSGESDVVASLRRAFEVADGQGESWLALQALHSLRFDTPITPCGPAGATRGPPRDHFFGPRSPCVSGGNRSFRTTPAERERLRNAGACSRPHPAEEHAMSDTIKH